VAGWHVTFRNKEWPLANNQQKKKKKKWGEVRGIGVDFFPEHPDKPTP
jgi:hypothetical protein